MKTPQHGVHEPGRPFVAVTAREVDRLVDGRVVVDAAHAAQLIDAQAQDLGDRRRQRLLSRRRRTARDTNRAAGAS